ncbi:chemotaxis protein CheD [Marinovum sp. 2_MG-2023]|uniref:chemotaxis protein CheD n=1 Tax=unclassified Marinovum TaxID=2647166 RepID=UPI0026E33C81|nr:MULTISPECIES: chemotaxis protein CheD [unclassified Marinovum]MDO6731607.1 chemotaxis protein CheD [Marinovum sp. 2_MG-2023]MDO6778267.1 chemotaxis protein CheD [Marinovum sp. 1_MG-2023]
MNSVMVKTDPNSSFPVNPVVRINVLQGETKFSDNPNELMTAILGSCVATAMWDPVALVGGMNHFLLPGNTHRSSGNLRFGVNAMELLVNGLINRGARRDRLQVKLFGGAKMYSSGKEIGLANARFAEWFMQQENFPVVSRCLGGQQGRKLRFWPTTGRAQRLFLEEMGDAAPLPAMFQTSRKAAKPDHGDIELF